MNPATLIRQAESVASTQQKQVAACAEFFQEALDAAVDQEQSAILPVEAYSLPDWYADLIPEQCMLTPSINYAYWNQVEVFAADGTISSQEQAVLKSMRENDTARQTELENAAWRDGHRQELSEYFSILHEYFVEALRENDIQGPEDYYENMVLNQAGSEQVGRSFMERLTADPRALELMEELKITLPA